MMQCGLLRGNERCTVTWTFTPQRVQHYEARVALQQVHPSALQDAGSGPVAGTFTAGRDIWTPGGPTGAMAGALSPRSPGREAEAGKLILTLVGEGTPGVLSFEPAALDLGQLRVGYPEEATVSMVNSSNGVVRYSLRLQASAAETAAAARLVPAVDWSSGAKGMLASSTAGHSGSRPPGEAWVSEPEGVVHARSSKQVTIGMDGPGRFLPWHPCPQLQLFLCPTFGAVQ